MGSGATELEESYNKHGAVKLRLIIGTGVGLKIDSCSEERSMLVDCCLNFLCSESKEYFVVMSPNDSRILIPWRRIRDAEEGSCLGEKKNV